MSYITIDKGILHKPKFRRLLRETGMDEHTLLGHLCHIWIIADEIGHELVGTDEDICSALSAQSALVCALCAVGWAERFEGGIYLHSNDPGSARREEQRAQAKRDRARRSYERKVSAKSGNSAPHSAPVCASALPIQPSSLTIQPNHPEREDMRAGAEFRDREIESAIAEHRGPNASLNFALSRDPVVASAWKAIPKSWAKEPGTNRAKLAAAIQAEQDDTGVEREEAARVVTDAIVAYCESVEGRGEFRRSLGRWLDAEGWRESPESWNRKGEQVDKQAEKLKSTLKVWGIEEDQ